MAAHQAPPSLGFSRQEHWSGLPFPSPMHESESGVAQLCPTLSDPMDCSSPGSSVHGIFQARVLEWDAIAFSGIISRFCFSINSWPSWLFISIYLPLLVTQSCPALCNPIDYSLPGSSVHEILQARIAKWVAIPFSRVSSRPRDWTWVSCIAGGFFTVWAVCLCWVLIEARGIFDLCCGLGIFSFSMWYPVPSSGLEPWRPALGAWSLNHWTTKKVPLPSSQLSDSLSLEGIQENCIFFLTISFFRWTVNKL